MIDVRNIRRVSKRRGVLRFVLSWLVKMSIAFVFCGAIILGIPALVYWITK